MIGLLYSGAAEKKERPADRSRALAHAAGGNGRELVGDDDARQHSLMPIAAEDVAMNAV